LDILQVLKENWLLILLGVFGLIAINGRTIFTYLQKMKPQPKPQPDISNVGSLPQVISIIEELAILLKNSGFEKSSVEAKNLLKTVVNEYSEI